MGRYEGTTGSVTGNDDRSAGDTVRLSVGDGEASVAPLRFDGEAFVAVHLPTESLTATEARRLAHALLLVAELLVEDEAAGQWPPGALTRSARRPLPRE